MLPPRNKQLLQHLWQGGVGRVVYYPVRLMICDSMKNKPPPGAPNSAKKKSKPSIFDQIEVNNAAFLNAAFAQSMATELSRMKVRGDMGDVAFCTAHRRQHPPCRVQVSTGSSAQVQASSPAASAAAAIHAASPPILGGVHVDRQELTRRADRRQRFLEEQASAAALVKIKLSEPTLVQARARGRGVASGKNQNLEKEYLRLTSLPCVSDVRPPSVLRQALDLVQRRWAEGCEYLYACDQLKSIRQDLTVQHERSSLTVAVYETHARIAVEVGDWAELRQSHSVLRQLYYAEGLGGERAEFAAYGLMLAAAAGRDMLAHEFKEVLGGATGLDPGEPLLSHALAACAAFSSNNYVALLKLYPAAPRMSAYLLDLLVEKLRPRAYNCILAAYQPTVPLAAVGLWLGCADKAAAAEYVHSVKGVVVGTGRLLDTKLSKG